MRDWRKYLEHEVDKIYFDMDDTIADFSRGLKELCGINPVPQDLSTPEEDDAMWAAIKETDHFYYKLKKCRFGMELLEEFRFLFGDKVEILTAVPKAKRGIASAEEDKLRWVEKHIGKDIVVNIVHSAEEKKHYAEPQCFLIDDLSENIEQWENAGGIGIHYWNHDIQSTVDAISKTALRFTLDLRKSLSCPDCGKPVEKHQRYCEMCGAEIQAYGGPAVNYKGMVVLYGPLPDTAEVTCPNCNANWTAYRPFREDDSKRFCKRCGTCIDNVEFKDFYSR